MSLENKNKRAYIIIKRFLDFILSLFLLIVLSPILILISIAIKLDSHGPVLYKQKRTGKDGKEFTLYKFRSMVADNDVYDFKTEDKITNVGGIIRKTSLDELPQLINIVKGDMSFIGPRPWVTICYNYFTDYQKKRNSLRPGITGYAQVSGRKNLNILDRIDYDIHYVENISFSMDFEIFIKTIIVVFKKSDVYSSSYGLEDEISDLKVNYEKESKDKVKE